MNSGIAAEQPSANVRRAGSLAAMRRLGLCLLLSLCACPPAPVPPEAKKAQPKKELETSWVKLETVPYKGKQDDIFFVDL
jgi:hypothetical protein